MNIGYNRKTRPATFRTMEKYNSENDLFRLIFRPFDSNKGELFGTNEKWLISQHILGIPERILKYLDMNKTYPDDIYILCVTYGKGGWGNGGDTQLFVTGAIEKNESAIDAAYGELAEETRYIPREEKNLVEVSDNVASGTDNIKWFYCEAINMSFVDIVPKRPNTKEKKKNKIGCIVYGTRNEMINMISQFDKSVSTGHDQIVGLSIISLDDVLKLIPMVRAHKMKQSRNHLMIDFSTI
jgi:hypothetical protein